MRIGILWIVKQAPPRNRGFLLYGNPSSYGSMFWHASARATFFLKLAAEDGDTRIVGVFNRKRNLGRLQPPMGLQVTFSEERVTFNHTDLADVPDLAESLPLWRRVQSVVKAGPQTLATIARELNHDNVESIDRIVRKHKAVFTKITGSDGITRVAIGPRVLPAAGADSAYVGDERPRGFRITCPNRGRRSFSTSYVQRRTRSGCDAARLDLAPCPGWISFSLMSCSPVS